MGSVARGVRPPRGQGGAKRGNRSAESASRRRGGGGISRPLPPAWASLRSPCSSRSRRTHGRSTPSITAKPPNRRRAIFTLLPTRRPCRMSSTGSMPIRQRGDASSLSTPTAIRAALREAGARRFLKDAMARVEAIDPSHSARRRITPLQATVVVALLLTVATGFILEPLATLVLVELTRGSVFRWRRRRPVRRRRPRAGSAGTTPGSGRPWKKSGPSIPCSSRSATRPTCSLSSLPDSTGSIGRATAWTSSLSSTRTTSSRSARQERWRARRPMRSSSSPPAAPGPSLWRSNTRSPSRSANSSRSMMPRTARIRARSPRPTRHSDRDRQASPACRHRW